jgi:hypothetical protein
MTQLAIRYIVRGSPSSSVYQTSACEESRMAFVGINVSEEHSVTITGGKQQAKNVSCKEQSCS